MAIKLALVPGLMAAGARVKDIGLALSPMAYFAQFALDVPSVAMVTASHNENGWTGVKMGCERPLTFGPEEMGALRDIVLSGDFELAGGGAYEFVPGMRETYIADLTKGMSIKRRLKVVAACGNGTAGAFAPEALERIGCDVIPLDAELDHTFPHYNPNPEDMEMLHAMPRQGDGDRRRYRPRFRRRRRPLRRRRQRRQGDLCRQDRRHARPRISASSIRARPFVVDVKSTGLFATDPVLIAKGARTDYCKTGHSYIKRRVDELSAIAGFEKSGHFFFNPPIGRGYDDGMVTAIAILRHARSQSREIDGRSLSRPALDLGLADHVAALRRRAEIRRGRAGAHRLPGDAGGGEPFAGQQIVALVTVNGVRVTAEDGTWGLVRASSNKPELVVVVESPVSSERRRAMFQAVDAVLRSNPEVGAYNQTF